MGMLDEIVALKTERKKWEKYSWHSSSLSVRCFHDDGQRTNEADPPKDLIAKAMGVTKYSGENISWSSSRHVGAAIKECVLRFLDDRIAELSKRAEQEAVEVLEAIKR